MLGCSVGKYFEGFVFCSEDAYFLLGILMMSLILCADLRIDFSLSSVCFSLLLRLKQQFPMIIVVIINIFE